VPTNSALLEETEALEELMEPPKQDTPTQDALVSDGLQEAATVPQTSGSSLVQRMSGGSSECDSTPVVQVGRPMPQPKSKGMSKSAMGRFWDSIVA
jgi:hypothetical protein